MREGMSQTTDDKPRVKKPLSQSQLILWGLLLGLFCGVFFGEYCRPLKVVGDAFVMLLQVTVLPYITISLILGIGGLTGPQARELARKAGTLLLLFWGIALLTVAVLPLSFPHWKSAAFFSTTLLEEVPAPDFLNLYIPANPFRSLADNVVPAVVLFSILMGVALMGVKEKSGLLRSLATASEALSRVTDLIVKLTPIGLFAIAASAAGTMSVEEFGRLQVFLVAYIAAALLLTVWVLPALVAVATPFTYREVVGLSRDALITAFVTGNLLVVLPVLTTRIKELFQKRQLERDTTAAYVDVIVPVSFNFPNVGKVLLLVFPLFAAWFSGSSLGVAQYPGFMATGLLSFFGSLNIAIPYLLDVLKLPADLFQLYLIAGIVTSWFATLLAAMNLLVFTILSVSLLTGVASIRKARVLAYTGLTALLMLILVGGLRLYFGQFVKNHYTMDEVVGQMHLMNEPFTATIYAAPPPPPAHTPGQSRLDEIRERGFLRVGYLPDRLPYAFTNARGDLVGFDIEMAFDLARTLNVRLEFVPLNREQLMEQVNSGVCDLLMSALPLTPERAAGLQLSRSYRDESMALIVASHRRKEFRDRDKLREWKGLRVGILGDAYYLAQLRAALPKAEAVALASPRDFFEEEYRDLDAFLFTAEAGSAWTLLYPQFAVVVPQPGLTSFPLVYAAPRGEIKWVDYVNAWIELKQKDGTTERLYNYWILGRGAVEPKPRWSVIRDVLHWVK